MPKCKHCGKRYQRCSGRAQTYCSFDCYLSVLFPRAGVTADDIKECRGMTIKDAAYCLDISYVQLRRKLKASPELRRLFPKNGAEGRWLAERGYA